MNIRHHTGHVYFVEGVSITPVPGGFRVFGVIEGSSTYYFAARKPSKVAATKELMNLAHERFQREYSEATELYNRLN